jgi:excinuclease ABC subunit A
VVGEAGAARFYSLKNFCHDCGRAFPDPQPATFSFHSARHRCTGCDGAGTVFHVPPELIFPDPDRPVGGLEPALADAALERALRRAWHRRLAALDLDPIARWAGLSDSERDALLTENHAASDEDRPANLLVARRRDLPAAEQRDFTLQYLREKPCPDCGGCRLGAAGRSFRLGGAGIAELVELPLDRLADWLAGEAAGWAARYPHSAVLVRELDRRLRTMARIGLDYLNLNRPTESLSGGELQRLRLAARLQNAMGGVLYVLDEPSIGLHPADFGRLMALLREIRDQGNTLLVVEHDEFTIRSADHVLDLGPGGGAGGGRVLYAGPADGLPASPGSVTGAYLSGRACIRLPARRRAAGRSGIALEAVRTHNLKSIRAFFPFGALTVVTGVSGSGKSSLVAETLYPLLRAHVQGRSVRHPDVGRFQLRGGRVDGVHFVDQSPVGRTPRSTPATYTGLFDEIRRFFARLPEAQARGLTASHFSHNTGAGRCAGCGGMGQVRVEMKFLPDSFVSCGGCQGRRYGWDVLKVRYAGLSIADVLDLSVAEALDRFRNFPALRRRLQVLADTGLGYVRLGQPTPTLSGGEQQRLKLGAHLLGTQLRHTVFLLDEPTTGLHFADIDTLCALVHHLVDAGNTVIAIEHNFDFIAQADHVLDLGPGGGESGGAVVYAGPLEGLAGAAGSATGAFLRRHIDRDCAPPGNRADYGV